MTTDRYTKAVLTIIAGALLYIGAMLSGQPASAQGQGATQGSPGMVMDARPQPVVVVGWAHARSGRCRSHRWSRSRCRSRSAARRISRCRWPSPASEPAHSGTRSG